MHEKLTLTYDIELLKSTQINEDAVLADQAPEVRLHH